MVANQVIDQLVELVETHETAEQAASEITPEELIAVSSELRQRVLFYLRRDAPRALAISDLILDIANFRDAPRLRALGLQTKAIALTVSMREFDKALDLFAESETIYRSFDDELDIALGQISRVWALACVQRYDEALTTGNETLKIFDRHRDYLSIAALSNNLAAIYGRRGQDQEALERILEVENAYRHLGEEGRRRLPLALINRAIVLRNLGSFSDSIFANETALDLAIEFSQEANIARAEQNLGITYFSLGQFTKAHALLEKARDTFLLDGRFRDAILVDLFISDGLLYLRRFEEVLAICQQVKETFSAVGTKFEVAQTLLNESTALAGLHAYDKALTALAEARQIFQEEENLSWLIFTDLEEASIQYIRQQYKTSERLVLRALDYLRAGKLRLKEALALTIAAKATLEDGRVGRSREYLDQALTIAESIDVPALSYQVYHLKGQLANSLGDRGIALSSYDAAIRELERLQGQIMVEFRADFLEDKNSVYSHAVDLCLQADNPEIALSYAERAKSRALLAMLGHHVDLRIEARSPADQPLVDEIIRLREQRDRLYRRWETGETPGSTVHREEEQKDGQIARNEGRKEILETEDRLRSLWHRLQVRNSAYNWDSSLWEVQTRLEQKALGEDTLLVEFFELPEGLVVFLVTGTKVEALRLPVSLPGIARQQQILQHNFSTLKQAPYLVEKLSARAKLILNKLYHALIAPWINKARKFNRLIVVPHGQLHYLPFHALFDGERYLLQQFQISYLPGSSFLGKKPEKKRQSTRALVMGHTSSGFLPEVIEEVQSVGRILNAPYYLNEKATKRRYQMDAPYCHLIHVAAHGDYKPINPLFSGLHLEEGLLTTLDIFNTQLTASLVTLSACQTGRNVIGGGDDLFGLTRAFLSSGAQSLYLTLWPVEDKTTTHLMQMIYDDLMTGMDKVSALRSAQMSLIEGSEGEITAHPYYWAPFFLVGDTGPL